MSIEYQIETNIWENNLFYINLHFYVNRFDAMRWTNFMIEFYGIRVFSVNYQCMQRSFALGEPPTSE